eukprot:452221-Pelagomonas_calceolata.AAC.3
MSTCALYAGLPQVAITCDCRAQLAEAVLHRGDLLPKLWQESPSTGISAQQSDCRAIAVCGSPACFADVAKAAGAKNVGLSAPVVVTWKLNNYHRRRNHRR